MWFIFDLLSRHSDADQGQHNRHFGQDTDRRRPRQPDWSRQRGPMAHGYGQFKEVGCSDESCRSRNVEGQFQQAAGTVGNEENKERLQCKGYGDEQNVNGIRHDDLGLRAEDDD